ncbi:uncharacterized mitochondrial protein AtMg00810-like [Cornus florida]|uniref:uncharacterized mitochondrial protein AtMg00810-like n=1 Tax=Cornus florida TaxID=4283 RepID=UPI00289D262F|nr:uncharacterized mitochondrial protein AtMg00810-like [Cornus florida]
MSKNFEMNIAGELTFFLGLQVKQLNDGIFISQSKYAKELVKKFSMKDSKHIQTPMSTSSKLDRDSDPNNVDHFLYRSMIGYTDVDWAGNKDDRKSISGDCFYVGTNLVSWYSKKQNCISLSSYEAEYIAVGTCCTQLLWMKQILLDYGVNQDHMFLELGGDFTTLTKFVELQRIDLGYFC